MSSQKGAEFSWYSSEILFASLSYIDLFPDREISDVFIQNQALKENCKHNSIISLGCYYKMLEALSKPTIFQQHSHL